MTFSGIVSTHFDQPVLIIGEDLQIHDIEHCRNFSNLIEEHSIPGLGPEEDILQLSEDLKQRETLSNTTEAIISYDLESNKPEAIIIL